MQQIRLSSATELAEMIKRRELSAVALLDFVLERIATVNPLINAVVQIPEKTARETALRADRALDQGELWGPLHGLPFTAKDIFDTAGVVTAAGVEERAHYIPDRDAVVIARMKAAGAILIGKTNVPPRGGGGECENPVYGRTNNPFDLNRTPGGSSGGEAAILAACGSPFGIGSDSGGSLRLPAHYCGVATLKPTSGRVPATGAFELPGGLTDPRSQIGPMARRVQDLWTVFQLIAGPDWRDSAVVSVPMGDPNTVDLAALRVAFYVEDGQAPATSETQKTVLETVGILADRGLVVEEALPGCIADARAITERYWGMSGRQSASDVETLMMDWDAFRSKMLGFMQGFDVLICPVDAAPAHLHDVDEALKFNYTLPFSLTGWPCAVVRAGTSNEGLPIAVQIVARPWREDIAIRIAQAIEETLGDWPVPLA